jgi:hypothetical protein
MAFQPANAARHKEKGNQNNIYLTEWARLKHQAELGDPDALFILGNYYYQPPKGSGFRKNLKESAKYYFKASVRGNANAQYNMAIMFLNGYGVKQDSIHAYAWFKIASVNTSPVAKHLIQKSAGAAQTLKDRMDESMLSAGTDKVDFYLRIIAEKRYREAKFPS